MRPLKDSMGYVYGPRTLFGIEIRMIPVAQFVGPQSATWSVRTECIKNDNDMLRFFCATLYNQIKLETGNGGISTRWRLEERA